MVSFVHAKPGDDVMNGYDHNRHQSPDHNYVPGYGERNAASPAVSKQPTASVSGGKKRDSLSNMWHTYAKNHSAEPYTEYHKAFNANIFNHVKSHYGIEVAKAMHGHAEALRQGHIFAIRKKYNIMESNETSSELHLKAMRDAEKHMRQTSKDDHDGKNKVTMTSYFHVPGTYPSIRESILPANDIRNPQDRSIQSRKALVRRLLAQFREKEIRNRKRLKKVSNVYAQQNLDSSAF